MDNGIYTSNIFPKYLNDPYSLGIGKVIDIISTTITGYHTIKIEGAVDNGSEVAFSNINLVGFPLNTWDNSHGFKHYTGGVGPSGVTISGTTYTDVTSITVDLSAIGKTYGVAFGGVSELGGSVSRTVTMALFMDDEVIPISSEVHYTLNSAYDVFPYTVQSASGYLSAGNHVIRLKAHTDSSESVLVNNSKIHSFNLTTTDGLGLDMVTNTSNASVSTTSTTYTDIISSTIVDHIYSKVMWILTNGVTTLTAGAKTLFQRLQGLTGTVDTETSITVEGTTDQQGAGVVGVEDAGTTTHTVIYQYKSMDGSDVTVDTWSLVGINLCLAEEPTGTFTSTITETITETITPTITETITKTVTQTVTPTVTPFPTFPVPTIIVDNRIGSPEWDGGSPLNVTFTAENVIYGGRWQVYLPFDVYPTVPNLCTVFMYNDPKFVLYGKNIVLPYISGTTYQTHDAQSATVTAVQFYGGMTAQMGFSNSGSATSVIPGIYTQEFWIAQPSCTPFLYAQININILSATITPTFTVTQTITETVTQTVTQTLTQTLTQTITPTNTPVAWITVVPAVPMLTLRIQGITHDHVVLAIHSEKFISSYILMIDGVPHVLEFPYDKKKLWWYYNAPLLHTAYLKARYLATTVYSNIVTIP